MFKSKRQLRRRIKELEAENAELRRNRPLSESEARLLANEAMRAAGHDPDQMEVIGVAVGPEGPQIL